MLYSSQVGQTSQGEVKKRDLRAELLAAEQEARNKKRKAEGKPIEDAAPEQQVDEEANKRRKLLQEALELDKDDDDDEDEKEEKDEDSRSVVASFLVSYPLLIPILVKRKIQTKKKMTLQNC